MSCSVVQEWQKLGAEYVASKHNAKSLHRLEAVLQVLHRLSVVSACTAQMLHVGLSVWHCMLPIIYNNLISPKMLKVTYCSANQLLLPVSKALLTLTARATACLQQQNCLHVCANLVADSTLRRFSTTLAHLMTAAVLDRSTHGLGQTLAQALRIDSSPSAPPAHTRTIH